MNITKSFVFGFLSVLPIGFAAIAVSPLTPASLRAADKKTRTSVT
jgi:hypothetical protein